MNGREKSKISRNQKLQAQIVLQQFNGFLKFKYIIFKFTREKATFSFQSQLSFLSSFSYHLMIKTSSLPDYQKRMSPTISRDDGECRCRSLHGDLHTMLGRLLSNEPTPSMSLSLLSEKLNCVIEDLFRYRRVEQASVFLSPVICHHIPLLLSSCRSWD